MSSVSLGDPIDPTDDYHSTSSWKAFKGVNVIVPKSPSFSYVVVFTFIMLLPYFLICVLFEVPSRSPLALSIGELLLPVSVRASLEKLDTLLSLIHI